jgi:multidrug efflux pump subunit AcrB
MDGMIAWFARNGVAANLLMVTIIALGLYAASERVPLEIFPDTSRNIINIEATYRGASPAEVEQAVNLRIEEAVADIIGIDNLYSNALEGVARIRLELLGGYEPNDILTEVKNRLDILKPQLPVEVDTPTASILKRGREVISVVVSGELPERQLRRLAQEVREDLTRLPDVTQVSFSGVRRFEISIEVPKHVLQSYGLTLADIARTIRQYSRDIPSGSIRTGGGEVLLRSLGQSYQARDFASIPVVTSEEGARVMLGEIATIRDGFEENPIYALFDGRPAVELDVYRVGEQSAIDVATAVKDYLLQKADDIPEGVQLAYWRDRASYVNARLTTLLRSALQGGVLIFLLLTLFLRLSVAIWVCVGIPISFLGALAVMPELGVTLNLISLFAFILVLGIVVDDAIVTGENIYSHLRRAEDATEAAIRGTQEISVPVTFGVLTTVAAFLPLLMVGGARGPIFAQIPMIVIPVLLFSLVESKLILPAHLKHIHLDRDKEKKLNGLQRMQRAVADGLETFIERFYRPLLDRALVHRYLTVALFVSITLVIFAFVASGRFGFTFFPRIQSEVARVSLVMERGVPVEVTEKHIRRITEIAIGLQQKYRDPVTGKSVIEHIMSYVGQTRSSGAQGTIGQSHLGRVSFEVTPPEKRSLTVTSTQLLREWRKEIGQIPGAKEAAFKAEIGHGGSPVAVQLEGHDFAMLRKAAEELKQHLEEVEGVFEIRDTFETGKEEIKLKLKPSAETLGITLDELGTQVRNAFFGAEAQRIQRNQDDIRVMVRLPASERASIADLEQLTIQTAAGSQVPLTELAELEAGRGYATIVRVNRVRTVTVKANINKDTTNINLITADLSEFLPEMMRHYPGLRYTFQGEQKEQKESMDSLKWGMLFVLFIIYSLLAIPFRSYVQPLIVMSVIPFSLAGAVLGHMIMGMNLSMMSVMGMLALAGVVVNDSLVLVDYVNKRRGEGAVLEDAIRQAGAARFRPILLTSLTTFFGLMPLILEKSTQAQFLIPMAVSLGFGIMFATVLTLFLIPVSYQILEDFKRRFM